MVMIHDIIIFKSYWQWRHMATSASSWHSSPSIILGSHVIMKPALSGGISTLRSAAQLLSFLTGFQCFSPMLLATLSMLHERRANPFAPTRHGNWVHPLLRLLTWRWVNGKVNIQALSHSRMPMMTRIWPSCGFAKVLSLYFGLVAAAPKTYRLLRYCIHQLVHPPVRINRLFNCWIQYPLSNAYTKMYPTT